METQKIIAVKYAFFGRGGGVVHKEFLAEANNSAQARQRVEDKASEYSQRFEFWQYKSAREVC